MGKPEELSNAQCLRVIGQHLDAHPVRAFRLRTLRASYIVTSDDLAEVPRQRFLYRIVRKAWAGGQPQRSDYLIFTRPEIYQADIARRAQRTASHVLDHRDVSAALRVLGDYFDRKHIAEFAIDWSEGSIVARHGAQQDSFTQAELYNFAVRMYLRRSERSR